MRGLLLFPQFPVGSCVCPAAAAAAEADRQFRPTPPTPHTLEEGVDVGQTATINRGKDMTHVAPWRLHSDDDTEERGRTEKRKGKEGCFGGVTSGGCVDSLGRWRKKMGLATTKDCSSLLLLYCEGEKRRKLITYSACPSSLPSSFRLTYVVARRRRQG